MTENMKKFLKAVSEGGWENVNKMEKEELIAFAKEKGIELTEEDFIQEEITEEAEKLTLDEMNSIAGGRYCLCVIGGGGGSDEKSDTCGCALIGFGNGTCFTKVSCIIVGG